MIDPFTLHMVISSIVIPKILIMAALIFLSDFLLFLVFPIIGSQRFDLYFNI